MTTGSGGVTTLLYRVDAATGRLTYSLSVIAATTIVLFMFIITADVLSRNLFFMPISGVADFVAYSTGACVLLMIGSSIRDGRLINADFLIGPWQDKRPILANGANALFYAVGTLIFVYATIWLYNDFAKAWRTNEFTGAVGAYMIRLWPFKLAVLIGAGFSTFEAARKTLIYVWMTIKLALEGQVINRGLIGLLLLTAMFVGLFCVMAFGNYPPVIIGLMSFAGLIILVACGMPVAFTLLVMSFISIWLIRDNFTVAQNALGIATAGAARSFEFGVVPLFVMMGLILDKADVGRDAFQVAVVALRKMKGGLGVATVAANTIFAAITGSSIASAAVFSRIAAPAMKENGYTGKYAAGIIAGSSILGMLIPPSILIIIYGLLAEISIGAMFIAAIVPGLLMAFAFAVLNIVMATWFQGFTGSPKEVVLDENTKQASGMSLLPIVALIALVMGGIYGGLFSPTEAGAIGAFGALLIAIQRKKVNWTTIKDVAMDTGYTTCGILFLIIAANLYARMLTLSTIPMEAASAIAAMNFELVGFVLCYILLVVLLGMILDSVSIMLVILPIALPVVSAMGGDLIWFGLITIVAVEIGLLTPPFGLAVFVVRGALPKGFATLGEIFTGAAPFALTMLLVTLLMVFVPGIVTVLL